MKIKYCLFVIILISCTNNNNLTIDVNIKDLKKGKLILSKFDDSWFKSIDSFNVSGQKNISLNTYLNEPQVLFLD